MGLFDTIALVGTLVLALPIGMLGVEFLVGGRIVEGVGFLAVAAALVVGQHYIGIPSFKKRLAGSAMDRIASDGAEPDDGANPDDGADPDDEAYKN